MVARAPKSPIRAHSLKRERSKANPYPRNRSSAHSKRRCSRRCFLDRNDARTEPSLTSNPTTHPPRHSSLDYKTPDQFEGSFNHSTKPHRSFFASLLHKFEPTLIETLQSAVNDVADENGWASLGLIGNRLNKNAPFSCKDHGFSTLKKLVCSMDVFEFKELSVGETQIPKIRKKKHSGSIR